MVNTTFASGATSALHPVSPGSSFALGRAFLLHTLGGGSSSSEPVRSTEGKPRLSEEGCVLKDLILRKRYIEHKKTENERGREKRKKRQELQDIQPRYASPRSDFAGVRSVLSLPTDQSCNSFLDM